MSIRRNRNLKKRLLFQILPLVFLLVCACGQDLTDDPIPPPTFPTTTLNLAFPEYKSLVIDRGFKLISVVPGSKISLGVRGIIIYREDASTYRAFEVNCSYHPNEASANVDVNSSGLFMTCSGCGSNFSFPEGAPSGGVAWRPLRKYRTELSGSYLTITNEIFN